MMEEKLVGTQADPLRARHHDASAPRALRITRPAGTPLVLRRLVL